jgi:hypothetical protein
MLKLDKKIINLTFVLLVLTIVFNNNIFGQENKSNSPIVIPMAGNTWLANYVDDARDKISKNGITNWNNAYNKFLIYFKLPQAGQLQIGLRVKVNVGHSKLKISLNGTSREVEISNAEYETITVGKFTIDSPGYHFVELEGIYKSGNEYANISDLLLSGEATEGRVYFVKDDFYWGRRGPSVHLSFEVPKNTNVEWFYNEITVPEGEDIIGSYFMANGFANGYFGIQVNSETERRVLFSVWSPYETQNPKDIPAEYKIELLKKGEDVYSGEFGNEGSGGQSYLKYNWKAGSTYGFLLRGYPIGDSNTVFTAYFYAPEVGEWELIASFRRPFSDSYLTRLYSFLENFHTETGNISRKAFYTNQWIYDNEGNWHELTSAKFTADATARKDSRLDYSGGIEDGKFFMKNCGFFNETTKIGSWFTRNDNGNKPDIDFSQLK